MAVQRASPLEPLERILSNPSEKPIKLSYQIIQAITQDFSVEIGRGGFGVVYLGSVPRGKIAVKKLFNYADLDDKLFTDEVNCLIRAKHENIVRFLGYCADTQGEMMEFRGRFVLADVRQRILCFEYLPKGTLYDYLKAEPSRDEWHTCYQMITGICEGLNYLHEECITHLDLKPDNILLDDQLKPKITDFGLSRCFDQGQSRVFTRNVSGTPGYIAPEAIDKGELSYKSDIFSLGVIIVKLLTGRNTYDVENWQNLLDVGGPEAEVCIKIAQACLHADQHMRPTIGKIIHELKALQKVVRTTSTEPGKMQLVITSNEAAPLLECKQKVMLEIAGINDTGERPGLDLVAVVDISASMLGQKMEQLKTALRFIVQKLSPIDRLSIVTFSDIPRRLCKLVPMTDAAKRELQMCISNLEACSDSHCTASITQGLQRGVSILSDRNVSECGGRAAAIMLMSGGRDNAPGVTGVVAGNVPVYTFGFGPYIDAKSLKEVAAKSVGGTFSHVSDINSGGLTMAFSQCLAGLLTVSVQQLELKIAAIGDVSMIGKVTVGNYPQEQEANGSVRTITLGDLYSGEVRNIIVNLLLPPAVHTGTCTEVLKVSYSYSSSSAGSGKEQIVVAPPKTLTVSVLRKQGAEEKLEAPELLAEEARLETAKTIKVARTLVHFDRLEDARVKLVEAQKLQSNPLLITELQELLELFQTKQTYQAMGHTYTLSSESSHECQRFTARGHDIQINRLFATPRMDMYMAQAKEFHKDPTMELPSVDDDIIAIRGDEMRRLSLEKEQSKSSDYSGTTEIIADEEEPIIPYDYCI